METMLLFITYFYISEKVEYCTILTTLYTKKIFQRKFLEQWRVGNGLADLRSYTFTVR